MEMRFSLGGVARSKFAYFIDLLGKIKEKSYETDKFVIRGKPPSVQTKFFYKLLKDYGVKVVE